MCEKKMNTIYEQYYNYVFIDEDGRGNGDWVYYSDPAEIIKEFNWNEKKHFTDTIYKDYVEDADTYEFSKYGSEPIVAEAEKLFYAIGTNEYVGNLDGVIGYRCAKANTEAFKSFLTYVNNKSIEDHDNTNFLVDATIDIFKDHDASTKKLMLKRARNIYDRFDMLDLDMDN